MGGVGKRRSLVAVEAQEQEQELVRALFRRVRLAVAEAERTVARSLALKSMRRVLAEEELLVRRCAWCARFSLGEGWMEEGDLPRFVPQRAVESATHTICPECQTRLVREGKSHTVGG